MVSLASMKNLGTLGLKYSAFAVSSYFFLGNVYVEIQRFLTDGFIEPAALTLFGGCLISSAWMVWDEIAIQVREKRLQDLIKLNCNPSYEATAVDLIPEGEILVTYTHVNTGHVYKRMLSL